MTPAEALPEVQRTLNWLKAFRAGLADSKPATEKDRQRVAAIVSAAALLIAVVERQLVELQLAADASTIQVTGAIGHA